jgi:peptidoglycan/LPS O-acetylase OafA/YrhL
VGGFTWWVNETFNKGICSIAVPFFFVVSGFFLAKHIHENHWWKREVNKRIKSLLIPYVSWSILYFLYTIPLILIANIIANTSLLRNFPTSLNGWLRILGLDPFYYPYLVPLWFVRCLFLFVLISPIITWTVKKSKFASSVFLLFILSFGILCDSFHPVAGEFLWFTVGTFSVVSLFYFSLGLHLALYPLQNASPKILTYLAGGLWIILLVLRGIASLYASCLSETFHFFSIPVGLYFVWHITSDRQWNHTLTQASFPIFILHMFFLSIIGLFIRHLIPSIEKTFVVCLIFSVLAFSGSIFLSFLMHKYFPRIAGFLFGGR